MLPYGFFGWIFCRWIAVVFAKMVLFFGGTKAAPYDVRANNECSHDVSTEIHLLRYIIYTTKNDKSIDFNGNICYNIKN